MERQLNTGWQTLLQISFRSLTPLSLEETCSDNRFTNNPLSTIVCQRDKKHVIYFSTFSIVTHFLETATVHIPACR
jgi:hypothetical protein